MAERKNVKKSPETNYVNELEIRGTVISIRSDEKYVAVVIGSANPLTGRRDFPAAFVFDQFMMESLKSEIKKGDRVTLHCYIETSKKYPRGTIVVEAFTKELSRVDAEFSGNEYLSDYNVGKIQGTLVGSVYRPNNSVCLFTVETSCKGRKAFVKFVKFGSSPVLDSKVEGDQLKIVFGVQSSTKIVDGKRDTTYTFVVQNVQ